MIGIVRSVNTKTLQEETNVTDAMNRRMPAAN